MKDGGSHALPHAYIILTTLTISTHKTITITTTSDSDPHLTNGGLKVISHAHQTL